MGNMVLASVLSAFATICIIVVFIIEFVVFIISVLFEKKIKEDKRKSKIIIMFTKFVTFLMAISIILEVIAVYIE